MAHKLTKTTATGIAIGIVLATGAISAQDKTSSKAKESLPVVVPNPTPAPKVPVRQDTRPQLKTDALRVALPSIRSVTRVEPPPGPAAEGFLLTAERVRVVGSNFGTGGTPPPVVLRYGGGSIGVALWAGQRPTNSEFILVLPGANQLQAAGISLPHSRPVAVELALTTPDGATIARHPIQFAVRGRGDADFDGDGATYGGTNSMGRDCNDFDSNAYPGHPELPDTDGIDNDCDPQTFGVVDRDGDGFPDAAVFNVDERNRRIYRGTDCNDADATANPIRPERCPAGSKPEERDIALRRSKGW
jgi:hypothetical protein